MFFVLIVGTIGITIDIVCSCIYNEIIKCIRIHFMAQKSNISLRKISKDKDQGYFFWTIMYTYTLRSRGKGANRNDLSG